MTAADTDTSSQAEPSSVSAVALDSVLVAGATMCGQSVSRIVVTLDDGRELSLDLPEPDQSPNGSKLSRTRQRILAILAESKKAMSRKQISGKLGRSSTHVAGKLSQDFTALIEEDYIFERDGLLTNDEAKFD